jgi:hypothetical protein
MTAGTALVSSIKFVVPLKRAVQTRLVSASKQEYSLDTLIISKYYTHAYKETTIL